MLRSLFDSKEVFTAPCLLSSYAPRLVWYGMVNVDLYSAIITKVLLIRSTGRAVLVLARPRPSIPLPSASLPFQCQINANRGPWQLFAQGRLGPTYVRQTKLYACERVDSRQWHEWHGQPLESIRHAGSYFVPISIRPIFIFFCCCRSYVKLLDD